MQLGIQIEEGGIQMTVIEYAIVFIVLLVISVLMWKAMTRTISTVFFLYFAIPLIYMFYLDHLIK